MNGLVVDSGATSHVVMDIAKLKNFDEKFSCLMACSPLESQSAKETQRFV